MKRFIGLAAAGAAAAVAFAVLGGGAAADGGKRIHVVERATTDTVVDLGAPGDSVGDTLAFANEVFDAANETKVGSDQGYCTRTVVGAAWECAWTTFLAGGQITVEGPFFDAEDSTLAVTGGTGKYRNVRGVLKLHARSATEFDFVFRLIG